MRSLHQPYRFATSLVAVLLLFTAADAQEPAPAPAVQPSEPDRWLLLCCGLPGDDGHRERLTNACKNVIAGAHSVLGIAPEQLRVLAGDEQMRDALAAEANQVDVCTTESVHASLRELGEKIPSDAGCWIVLLGHAHLYDSSSQFNVLGPDFDQNQFAEWAKSVECQEQVFWLTMPVSGFWTKPLAGPSRVIISATEADLEFTGTEMPYAFADVLAGKGEHQTLEDVDRDNSLSLLDLYLAVNLEIHHRFSSLERLQTEHAQLEDNGDGRSSELQQPYLPVEDTPVEDTPPKEETPGDEPAANEEAAAEEAAAVGAAPPEMPNPISNPVLDGFRSRHILIRKPQS